MTNVDARKIQFSIVKHVHVNEATTLDGFKVYRQDKVWIPEEGRFMVCAPYDNHFIYLDPSNKPHRWFAMCTCGSPAVIVGYQAYKKDASPTSGVGVLPGEMLICYFHSNTGKHADGSS